MKHSCNSLKFTESLDAGTSRNTTGSLSRRRFITLLSAGATSLAVQACGGGGGGDAPASASPVPPAAPAAPVPVTALPPAPVAPAPAPAPALAWSTVPTLVFTHGVPSTVSLKQWLTGANGTALALTLNSVPLPAGITYNSVTQSFDYDGIGAVASTDGHVLTVIGG